LKNEIINKKEGLIIMKIKTILFALLMLLTLCSASALYADTYVVGNSTFSLPDGYTIVEQANQVAIYNDDYVMTMYEGPILNPEQAKYKRMELGYDLIGERNYSFNKIKINQQNYNKNGITTCVYTFGKNNKTYIITLNVYEDQKIPEYENNPVTHIIESLK
jgi:hypothetical protein